MSSKQRTVEAVRDEVIAAAAELRRVAQAEYDERLANLADWLDELFAAHEGMACRAPSRGCRRQVALWDWCARERLPGECEELLVE